MKDWAIKRDSQDTSIFITNEMENKDFKSITKKERIPSENKTNTGTLSSVEQLLLSRNYVFSNSLSEYIWNPSGYDMKKLTLYTKHFKQVRFLYSGEQLKFIHLENPNESSIHQFSKQINNNNLSLFVKGLYFSPFNGFEKKDYSQVVPETGEKEIYTLDNNFIEPLNLTEQSSETELIHFLKNCYPNFRTEPDRLLFNENILNNFAVRLLATIYERISFVVEVSSKRILLLGVSK